MTDFTFDDSIPFTTNNPAVDQPVMLANNVANVGIWEVDHIGFNALNGGQHQWTQFPITSSFPTPPVPIAMSSVAFPGGGIANPAIAQYFFQNSLNTFQISANRAWAYAGTGGAIANQFWNVSTITRTVAGSYDVVLVSNAVSSVNFGVLLSSGVAPGGVLLVSGYNITGIGTFTVQFRIPSTGVLTDPLSFSFQVLQI